MTNDTPIKSTSSLQGKTKYIFIFVLIIFLAIGVIASVYFYTNKTGTDNSSQTFKEPYRLVSEKISQSALIKIFLPTQVHAEYAKANIEISPKIEGTWIAAEEQDAIAFGDDYLILVNPFPIFKTHFTISCNSHIDQRFIPNVQSLLELARAMEGFTVFYNGPECGASAPDHLHFQAGENGFMPIAEDFERLKPTARKLFSGAETNVWAFDKYLRKMISVETTSLDEGLRIIGIYYSYFQAMQPEKVEPMMNVLCAYSGGKWTIHLFPRKLHRPRQFFAEGNDQLLISPASVDFGGVFITPRKEDFDRITMDDIEDMFKQVSLNQDTFQELTAKIESDLN